MKVKRTFTAGRISTRRIPSQPFVDGPPVPKGYERVFVRCTPNCPYEDCIISIIDMPITAEGGDGEPSDEPSDRADDNPSDSSSDNNSGGKSESESGGNQESESPETAPASDKKDSPDPARPQQQRGTDPKSPSEPPPKPESKPADKPKPGSSKGTEKSQTGGSPPSRPTSPSPQPIEVEYRPAPVQPKEVDYSGFTGYGSSGTSTKNQPIPPAYKYLADRVFQSKLRNIMVDNSFDRPVRGRKRGKLDMRSLYKVPSKAENIFTLKEARKNKKYNVLLLVDESGSMSHKQRIKGVEKTRSQVAAECAVFLAQSFEGINLDLAIVGFNRNITVRKEFGQLANYDKIYKYIATQNNGNGSEDNNDWDGLNKAYTMFKPGMKGENILIMLSDGQPASFEDPLFWDIKGQKENPPPGTDKISAYQKNKIANLHHLVKNNDKRVKSIGIGIGQGGGQIPTHEVIHSLDELKPAIIKQLATRIKRG